MKKIIIANWKANPNSLHKAELILRGYQKYAYFFKRAECIVCPPLVMAPLLLSRIKALGARTGAQNVSSVPGGVHTGEVSASMIKSIGITHAIIGHSERRKMGETDDIIHEKIIQALKAQLIPILAVGENEKSEDAHHILDMQVKAVLRGVSLSGARKILFAYEPRWAISKGIHDTRGSSDTPEHAIEKMIYIRRIFARLYGAVPAQKVPVLYGGSVRSGNVALFVKKGYGFDGVLVGGASLNAREFTHLIRAVIAA